MKIAVSVLSCVLALSFLTSSPVQAQIPNEVMTSYKACLLYTSPSPRDRTRSRMPSSA